MKEWKDRTIDIFGTKYRIMFVDRAWQVDETMFASGVFLPATFTIKVALHDEDGKRYPDSEVGRTLCHEIMHCIFSDGMYQGCAGDEPLVEWCAKCIWSLIKQGVLCK